MLSELLSLCGMSRFSCGNKWQDGAVEQGGGLPTVPARPTVTAACRSRFGDLSAWTLTDDNSAVRRPDTDGLCGYRSVITTGEQVRSLRPGGHGVRVISGFRLNKARSGARSPDMSGMQSLYCLSVFVNVQNICYVLSVLSVYPVCPSDTCRNLLFAHCHPLLPGGQFG